MGSHPPLPICRRISPINRCLCFRFISWSMSFLSLNHHAFGTRDPSAPFSFPLSGGVPPSFLFRFRRLSDTSTTPCSLVVDKFFPSASSSHCLLSTNAVVGRSFTYSMVSFHNSPQSFPASRIPQSRFSIRSIRLSHHEFQSPLQSALSRLDFSSMELFGELEKETSYTASCRRNESFSSSGIWIFDG